jgi:biopolymer transport protein ExbD
MPIKTSSLDEMPPVNLTSMIDVLFLLIIFFMLGTRFIEEDRRIALELPRVGKQSNLPAAVEKKVVSIDRTGAIVFESKNVSLTELTGRLAAAREHNAKLGVLVRGDASAPLQLVASVLGACKEAGISDLGISVKVAKAGKSNGPR